MIWVCLALGYTAITSAIAFGLYGADKRRAVRNRAGADLRRVPERTLHLWELLGGWPGGLLARRIFRHKTDLRTKGRFVWTSSAVIAMHLVAWALIVYFVFFR